MRDPSIDGGELVEQDLEFLAAGVGKGSRRNRRKNSGGRALTGALRGRTAAIGANWGAATAGSQVSAENSGPDAGDSSSCPVGGCL